MQSVLQIATNGSLNIDFTHACWVLFDRYQFLTHWIISFRVYSDDTLVALMVKLCHLTCAPIIALSVEICNFRHYESNIPACGQL